jgi:hypothetical protein
MGLQHYVITFKGPIMAPKKHTKSTGDKKRHREHKKAIKKLLAAPKRKRGRPKAAFKPEPKPGSREFAALQKKWYSKLKKESAKGAKDGFKDIEWVDHKTGKGQQSDYLKGSDTMKHYVYNTSTLDYYRLCTNFYTHAWRTLAPKNRFIWKHWADGKSLRQIVILYNKHFRAHRSLYWIFRQFETIEVQMYKWNKENPEGLLNEANVDFYMTDLPLKNMRWFE